MPASFVVYIDESGDEGFAPGASEWFILSAVVLQAHCEFSTAKLVDDIRVLLASFRKDAKQRKTLHFKEMIHNQRVPYVERIAQESKRLRTITVLLHKPSLRERELFSEKGRMYYYASRYLFERLSWFCRDEAPKFIKRGLGDGTARITFSNRSNTSHKEFKAYLLRLKTQSATDPNITIHWPAFSLEDIDALPHHSRMGLQIADAVASSFFQGVTKRYGFVESRYAVALKPTVYSYKNTGRQIGYGIKIWPADADKLVESDTQLSWLYAQFAK